MFKLATVAEMREMERIAIEERAIPSLTLMERAGEALCEEVDTIIRRDLNEGSELLYTPDTRDVQEWSPGVQLDQIPIPPARRTVERARKQALARQAQERKPLAVAIFCGTGNNGGDGMVCARLLMARGYTVRVFLAGERAKMTPDCAEMERQFLAAGGQVERVSDLNAQELSVIMGRSAAVVDAIFGVGLTRKLEGPARFAVQCINMALCPVIACDIATGLHADTGEVMGIAVRADYTVTFSAAKYGHFLRSGMEYTGILHRALVGVPFEVKQAVRQGRVEAPAPGDFYLARRRRDSYKGDYGRIFILAGSVGYTGASVFAAQGAVRMGAGLVHLGVPAEIYPIVAGKCMSAMPYPLPQDMDEILARAASCDAALIGPGLGRTPEVQALVHHLCVNLKIPVVLDADGINALGAHIDSLDGRTAPTILTPHDGEFARLSGCELPLSDRLAAARAFAQAHRCTLLLKGHRSITAAADGRLWINTTGNPGMAKGGSGDVLGGMIVSLLGQGYEPAQATIVGAYLHGLAGDRAAQEMGEYAMTPEDLLAALPYVTRELTALK